jgi:hypothetical protein
MLFADGRQRAQDRVYAKGGLDLAETSLVSAVRESLGQLAPRGQWERPSKEEPFLSSVS